MVPHLEVEGGQHRLGLRLDHGAFGSWTCEPGNRSHVLPEGEDGDLSLICSQRTLEDEPTAMALDGAQLGRKHPTEEVGVIGRTLG